MVGDGQRHARGQQQRGIDGRQRPGAHGGEGFHRASRAPVLPAATLGQMALKSATAAHARSLPSVGTECTRAQYNAPKKAAKNMTSEKMNHDMLQRKETSMRSL